MIQGYTLTIFPNTAQHNMHNQRNRQKNFAMSLVMDKGHTFYKKTVDDILNTPRTYFKLHFDETTTLQIKKQFDILVRYYSDNHNEVRVRFLKVAVFGHAYAESVANEL